MADFTGTTGDDSLVGAAGDDSFHLEDGGEDIAKGNGGKDTFYLGGTLDSGDRIDGGTGAAQDLVVLDGDYGAGLALGASLVEVEMMQLTAGHSYKITDFADVVGLRFLLGGELGPDDHLIVDASDAPDAMDIYSGQGDDTITGTGGNDGILDFGGVNLLHGGDGDDLFALQGSGRVFGDAGDDSIWIEPTAAAATARLNGGKGYDTVLFQSDVTLTDQSLHSIEAVVLHGPTSIEFSDGNVRAGGIMAVSSDGMLAGGFVMDGSQETDGRFAVDTSDAKGGCDITGGALADRITAGAYEDTIDGGGGDDKIINSGGNDLLQGGDGDDVIHGGRGSGFLGGASLDGGLGSDTLLGAAKLDVFLYHSIADSTLENPDFIAKLSAKDVVDLSAIDADVTQGGDQAFVLADTFDGHAGELVRTYDSGSNTTTVEGDVDGDGSADFRILVHGDSLNHGVFDDHFVL